MKTCTHCGKQNPADANVCYGCRNPLKTGTEPEARKSFWAKLPSWAWILIGLAGIAVFLGVIIGGFIGLATVEGFASVLFLIVGVLAFRVFSGTQPSHVPLFRALLIGFFALMGATVDQTGNPVYNKPVEWCFCPPGASLSRATDVSNPLPGRTALTQNFSCWKEGEVVKRISPFAVMGLRFVEYLLLGYGLIGLRWLWWKRKSANKALAV